VFVEAAHFNNPVRPSSVIVNDVTILNKTKEVGGIKRETRSFAAAPSQKVVVNEGPGVDAIRKSTGKTVGVVSIQEAVRQTPVPSNALGKLNESRRKDGRPDPQSSAGVTTPGSGKVGGSDAETQYPGAQKSHPDKPGKPGKGKKKDGGKGKD
jgi:hypothetical protein